MRRILLDENLPRLLKRELSSAEVWTVAEVGWAGIKNGKLLRLAEAEFDVLVTADQNLSYQQPLKTFNLGIVVLRARTTKLEDLLPLAADLREAVDRVAFGQLLRTATCLADPYGNWLQFFERPAPKRQKP